jgi:hypothetical protein
MDNSITEMFFKGYIDRQEAIAWSSNPSKMEKLLVSKRESDKSESS